MTAATIHDIQYLQDVKWQYHDSMMLGDKAYLSADIQQNLFDVAHISLEVPYRLNQKNRRPPTGHTENSEKESRLYSHNSMTSS